MLSISELSTGRLQRCMAFFRNLFSRKRTKGKIPVQESVSGPQDNYASENDGGNRTQAIPSPVIDERKSLSTSALEDGGEVAEQEFDPTFLARGPPLDRSKGSPANGKIDPKDDELNSKKGVKDPNKGGTAGKGPGGKLKPT